MRRINSHCAEEATHRRYLVSVEGEKAQRRESGGVRAKCADASIADAVVLQIELGSEES
jgi:hypothetical protein